MKGQHLRWSVLVLPLLLLGGCQVKPVATGGTPSGTHSVEADIKANLAKLDPEDQRLAEQQKYCPVMPDSRLGEMGPPHKIVLKGQALLVCCPNCVQPAQDEPDKTLAQLKELKK